VTLFTPLRLRNVTLPNRFVRSATYEGLADPDGRPTPPLGELYARLAENGVGTIVTGFAYASRAGRSMQPLQCGIDHDGHIDAWAGVAGTAKEARADCLLFMQIAHCGRQTLADANGGDVMAPSGGRSPYFRSRPRVMKEGDVATVIGEFAAAGDRARRAGFDGVQIHAAHGYLIHQFLSPARNRRRDRWGRDRGAFLREIVAATKERCGDDFPILVKMSGADEDRGGMTPDLAAEYAAELDALGVDAVEVTHGTMDLAFNIFRGGAPVNLALEVNPLFNRRPGWQIALWRQTGWRRMRRRLEPLTEAYNRESARVIRRRTDVPLILVGGMRTLEVMEDVVESGDADAIGMSRPLIAEPDLVARFETRRSTRSHCSNCNECAVTCDRAAPVVCRPRTEGELP